ncbi:MAG: 2-C-methyl-D-erythritol 2,4-cyclodiphosphate synthase [Nitrospinota bacterium]
MRVGVGYDAHALGPGRKLVLGGVEGPHDRGLQGHSDADVALHALCDALLGAAALGDIGGHFPDTDARYKDIPSLVLLEGVRDLLGERGYRPLNVDVTIVAQKPRLTPYVPEMRSRIAAGLGVPPEAVSVKATTTEGLGFAGREEGIAAHAVCTIQSQENS